MIYIKPIFKSYTADGILEELGPGQMQYTVTLNTKIGEVGGDIDGYIDCVGVVYTVNTNGEESGEATGLKVGVEEGEDIVTRGFVGFDISSIHSTVVSATLKIYQGYTEDFPGSAGGLVVDHIDFGSKLEAGDFGTPGTELGAISIDDDIEWKTMDVTDTIQSDLDSGRSYSQFRLHFSNEGVEIGWVDFADSEGNIAANKTPELVITYY